MYVVFDIGGTKSRVALTEDFVTLENIKSFATPKSFKAGLEALTKAIDEMKFPKLIGYFDVDEKLTLGGVLSIVTFVALTISVFVELVIKQLML